ncbi:5553_t:CDS:2 [Dentiscutata erythropus]|uniref:5553_t:CDS:1 n=1 Tax=Dentiscutata erythropus TaxID=1348616 RepID=A0A9N9C6Z0_9GLOM|nr:5553_t:CDS:2 [Dentiscutata erythropus]
MVREESASKVFEYFINTFLILCSRGIISNELIKNQEEFNALKNHILRIRISNYQAALENAFNDQFPYDNKKDFIRLHDDINKFHNKVIIFVTDLKNDAYMHSNRISELLQHYKCKTEISSQRPTQLIKEVLKRLVIDIIIDMVNTYFEFNEADNFYPGKNVIGLLLKKLCLLTVKRSDNIMKEIPVKERQQIYLFLKNLVFGEDENHEHSFIHNSKKQLINTIDQYRTIIKYSKRKEIEDYASSLIRDVIDIFYFRRYTFEQIIDYMWIKNNKPIDPLSINKVWDDDADIDNLVVQFCSFPLFGRKKNSFQIQ